MRDRATLRDMKPFASRRHVYPTICVPPRRYYDARAQGRNGIDAIQQNYYGAALFTFKLPAIFSSTIIDRCH